MKHFSTGSVSFRVAAATRSTFFPLLQRGVMVRVQVGCSIKSLFCEQLGVHPEYLEERIKTIFLDGRAVDDVDTVIVEDDSTLAISAAMPGLVGATLRRGGHLASLRSGVTHQAEQKHGSQREGFICLKLFNLLVSELGPIVLKRGVYLKRNDWEGFLRRLPETFWTQCKTVEVDGQQVTRDYVFGMAWLHNDDIVMLRVDSDATP